MSDEIPDLLAALQASIDRAKAGRVLIAAGHKARCATLSGSTCDCGKETT